LEIDFQAFGKRNPQLMEEPLPFFGRLGDAAQADLPAEKKLLTK
jgi:hypothetical protein